MGQPMSLYKYTIPLEESDGSTKPVYEYPQGNEDERYEENGKLVVIQVRAIPQFYRDSVAVEVETVEREVQDTAVGVDRPSFG